MNTNRNDMRHISAISYELALSTSEERSWFEAYLTKWRVETRNWIVQPISIQITLDLLGESIMDETCPLAQKRVHSNAFWRTWKCQSYTFNFFSFYSNDMKPVPFYSLNPYKIAPLYPITSSQLPFATQRLKVPLQGVTLRGLPLFNSAKNNKSAQSFYANLECSW
jgi:hypothetical protein